MAVGVAMMVGAMATDPVQSGPKPCPPTTPGPDGKNKCPLAAPKDAEFSTVCHPGALGHAGGAEQPNSRCPGNNYTTGEFRCACCGAPLFHGAHKILPAGDGWPAFDGNASWVSNGTYAPAGTSTVCTPPTGGTEVVCASCGSHLGDYFAAGVLSPYAYYCIDGVCLLPPGAPAGHVCEPAGPGKQQSATKIEADKALRASLQAAHTEMAGQSALE